LSLPCAGAGCCQRFDPKCCVPDSPRRPRCGRIPSPGSRVQIGPPASPLPVRPAGVPDPSTVGTSQTSGPPVADTRPEECPVGPPGRSPSGPCAPVVSKISVCVRWISLPRADVMESKSGSAVRIAEERLPSPGTSVGKRSNSYVFTRPVTIRSRFLSHWQLECATSRLSSMTCGNPCVRRLRRGRSLTRSRPPFTNTVRRRLQGQGSHLYPCDSARSRIPSYLA
jgi:hypothetical protein